MVVDADGDWAAVEAGRCCGVGFERDDDNGGSDGGAFDGLYLHPVAGELDVLNCEFSAIDAADVDVRVCGVRADALDDGQARVDGELNVGRVGDGDREAMALGRKSGSVLDDGFDVGDV